MYKISPAYFSHSDLIDEYIDLYTMVLWVSCINNGIDGDNCNKLVTNFGSCLSCPSFNSFTFREVEFNCDDLLFFDYVIKNLYAEIKFRDLLILEDLQNQLYETFDKITKNDIINILNRCIDRYSKEPYVQLCELKNINTDARIPIPKNAQQLWSHHKYSIMARDVNLYKEIGKEVADNKSQEYFEKLCLLLSRKLTEKPAKKAILNSLQHMWGYISDWSDIKKSEVVKLSLKEFFEQIQRCVELSNQEYLMQQTATVELGTWKY